MYLREHEREAVPSQENLFIITCEHRSCGPLVRIEISVGVSLSLHILEPHIHKKWSRVCSVKEDGLSATFLGEGPSSHHHSSWQRPSFPRRKIKIAGMQRAARGARDYRAGMCVLSVDR